MRLSISKQEIESLLYCLNFSIKDSSRAYRDQPPYEIGIDRLVELRKKLEKVQSYDNRIAVLVPRNDTTEGLATGEDRKLA